MKTIYLLGIRNRDDKIIAWFESKDVALAKIAELGLVDYIFVNKTIKITENCDLKIPRPEMIYQCQLYSETRVITGYKTKNLLSWQNVPEEGAQITQVGWVIIESLVSYADCVKMAENLLAKYNVMRIPSGTFIVKGELLI